MKWNVIVTISLAVLAALAWLASFLELFFGNVFRSDSDLYLAFPKALTACACVGWVLVTVSHWRQVGEPRCRKCRYVLKGLSEPRCPECGEPI